VIGALVLALSDRVQAAAAAEAPEDGAAAAALALLAHAPGQPIEQLRRALGLSHPGAVRLVDRLVADGLVERRRAIHDGRAVALHLTAAGDGACGRILGARADALGAALGSLGEDELAAFGDAAAKVLRHLVEDVDDAYRACRLCDPVACTDCPVAAELEARAGAE